MPAPTPSWGELLHQGQEHIFEWHLVVFPLLALFIALQAGRVWVIATLGRYWTTRIITVAEAPLITGGPYRWVRHPNYVVVAAEIVVLPLVFSQVWIAIAAGAATALLLRHRIAVEDQALSGRR